MTEDVGSKVEGHARLIAAATSMARTIRYSRVALWDLVRHLPENAPERTAMAMMDGCIDLLDGRSSALNADPRPADCRFRLQDEGKAYPRSSCPACGSSIGRGLGRQCGVYQPTAAFVDGPAPTPRKF